MLSGDLAELLTVDNIESPFGTPGKPVPRIKASVVMALGSWVRTPRRATARNPEFKRGQLGQLGMGEDLMKLVCSPGADVRSVLRRGTRMGMLMTMCGKQEESASRDPLQDLLKLPMKWWAVGESHRGLF